MSSAHSEIGALSRPGRARKPVLRSLGVRWPLLAGFTLLLAASPCPAQEPSPRDELLRLVPPDTGVCLLVSNLREHAKGLENATWLKALRASPIGQMLAASPEANQLAKHESDLKHLLGIDLAHLRDDILGDLVVLAYRPGPPDKPQDEEGLLLLWSREPDVLKQLIERLNEVQARGQQLKAIEAIAYKGQEYFRRSEQGKSHYYLVHGSLLAFSSKESLIRRAIDQRQQKANRAHPLAEQLQRARADKSLAAVWLNPRAFDADLQRKAKQALGPDAQVLQSFLTYWKALDAVILTANAGDSLELKLTLQARAQDLPKSVRRLFSDNVTRSDLWARFPADSILRIAGRLDAEALAETLAELTPESARSNIADTTQRYIGASLGVDLARDVLPNIGPDWGICIVGGPKQSDIPVVIAALAVKPGKMAVDQSIYKGARFLAGLGILWYNSSHADPISLQTTVLDKVEVQYLANDKTFPTGFQPAFALKDGYFLLASSPDAIRSFKKATAPAIPDGENPLVQMSLNQLSKFIKVRRHKVVAGIAEKNQVTNAVAEQWLDALLTGLDLFDHLLLSERRETGQVTWSLRLASR
jgi:hypothetical protein